MIGCTDIEDILGYLQSFDIEGNRNGIDTYTQRVTLNEEEVTIIRTIRTKANGEVENIFLIINYANKSCGKPL